MTLILAQILVKIAFYAEFFSQTLKKNIGKNH